MTNEKLHLIVLGGILHDIGKLLERGEIFKEARQDEEYLKVCPENIKGRYPTHLHAAHTANFCDWLKKQFDCLANTDFPDWTLWCAAHHRNDETGPEASVIRISDRLSSGERDEGEYYQKDIHRRTFLEPVIERISLEGFPDCTATRYRYPPVKLTSDRETLFPQKGPAVSIGKTTITLGQMENPDGKIEDKSQWCHLTATDSMPVIEAYRKLAEGLMAEIEALSKQNRSIDLADLLVCLMTLLEKYTANVPAATNLRHPDISLFDHLRTTAAIAQALYLQLENEGRFMTAMAKDDSQPRWVLVCGDFSGIQKFIYNLTNKGAARGLRGRSFYVSHFCRICADYLIRELGLTKAALLYNSGGKFYLLIPSFMKIRLYKIRSKINSLLLDQFNGDVFFGIGTADVSAGMFSLGKMDQAWKTAVLDLEKDRMSKFRDQMVEDQDFFNPKTGHNPGEHCRVCGNCAELKKVDKDGEIILQCAPCEAMENLGRYISDTQAVVTLHGNPADIHKTMEKIGLQNGRKYELENWNICYLMVPEKCLHNLKGLTLAGECAFLNEWADRELKDLPLPRCAITSLYLGKWNKNPKTDPNHSEQLKIWEFDDYAKNAKGIERLGVLRMDVDNLGTIFIKGLWFPRRAGNGWGELAEKNGLPEKAPMASISRMVTLSRQLNHFFSGYLTTLLKQDTSFDKCRIVYAGGDDLFIIGSWHQLPELAKTIRQDFKEFCCQNPVFSISGGLTLQRGKYPIYKGAQLAGQAEKQAKELRKAWISNGNRIKKDGFSFLGVPMLWEDFDIAVQIREMLEQDMKDNRGLLSFLSQMTAANIGLVKDIQRTKGVSLSGAWEEIRYASWRWRTAYQLRRRYKQNQQKINLWSSLLFNGQADKKTSTLPVYAWLEMPLRWAEFLDRK